VGTSLLPASSAGDPLTRGSLRRLPFKAIAIAQRFLSLMEQERVRSRLRYWIASAR